jgi:type VI protein secretion system component Hcp
MDVYLRFGDRRFAGESRYRKSEGWIDVVSWEHRNHAIPPGWATPPSDKSDGTLVVQCVPDRATVPLFAAFQRGEALDSVVLEDWRKPVWRRLTMTDVIITSLLATKSDDGSPVTQLRLEFRQSTLIVGKKGK